MLSRIILISGVLIIGVSCHPDADNHIRKEIEEENVGIIGGHQVTIEMVPFMVSLRLNGTYHWCGGSIIHEKFIITAAHCILPNRTYKVLVGTDNIDKSGELYEIEEIIKHEKYNPKSCDYDVCLLKLKQPLAFSSKVAKIPLASPTTKLTRGLMLNVTGWGSTGAEDVSSDLLQVAVPLVNRHSCQKQYFRVKHAITNHMLCAGSHGRDACQGDSGGPLSYSNELVGITSFGYDCGKYPGVYTRVASVHTWVKNIIESH